MITPIDNTDYKLRYQVNASTFTSNYEQRFINLTEAFIKAYQLGLAGYSDLEVINLETNENLLHSDDMQGVYQKWN